jgi:hypothetical protein
VAALAAPILVGAVALQRPEREKPVCGMEGEAVVCPCVDGSTSDMAMALGWLVSEGERERDMEAVRSGGHNGGGGRRWCGWRPRDAQGRGVWRLAQAW